MKTLSVEKARENYEKAKEKAEALQAKTAAAVKHLRKCEADLIEAENAEYIRIVREMNLSIAELRQIRKERKPLDALKENRNEEETRKNENEDTQPEVETEGEDGLEKGEESENGSTEEEDQSPETV